MLRFGLFLGTVGLGLLIVTGIAAYKVLGPGGGLHTDGQFKYRYVVELDAAQTEAELARLRGLPDGALPATLGEVAGAKAACVVGMMSSKPNAAAIEAARRYFTVVFAIHDKVSSGLIDPRARDFKFSIADSPVELRTLVENGDISESQVQGWSDLVSDYIHAGHPLYAGLGLDQGGWAYADFTNILALGQANWERIARCYRSRVGG